MTRHKGTYDRLGNPLGARQAPQAPPETRSPDYSLGYGNGYAVGYRAGQRSMEPEQPPRQPWSKYPFATMAVDEIQIVPEPNTQRVYNAARQWAWRNAPSRRYTCHPTIINSEPVTKITRYK